MPLRHPRDASAMVGQRRSLPDYGHVGYGCPEDGRSWRDFRPTSWLLVVSQIYGVAMVL